MKLSRERILEVLVTVLHETQAIVIEEPELISEETVPIGDLYDFDSLTSVEVTVDVLITLGFEESEFPSYPSVFISRQKMALTVGQVADRILGLKSRLN